MKFKYVTLSLLGLLFTAYSVPSYAFKVDKMIIVGDDKGNGIVTLTNDESKPLFITTEIDEITVEDGVNINKVPYSRDNLTDWKIALTYQKVVLQPGESKDIGIRSLCHNTTCDDSQDLMFMMSFIPSKLPDDKGRSGVDINYGFAPVYIIPTTDPKFSYTIENKGDEMVVKNDSNTMISLLVDSCSSSVTNQCRQKYTVVAGREKTFKLSENLQRDELNITVTSHNRQYSTKEIVKRSK